MGQWSGISDFFAMGGYAQYVWGAYGRSEEHTSELQSL